MIGQMKIINDTTIRNELDHKIEIAIKRIKTFEPLEGYYLAFSGGKDSIVIHHLANLAKVKFDSNYNHTTVDPPELIYFIKENYPNTIFNYPKETMWQLIVRKRMPPTRIVRYCCSELKEHGGDGRFVITGVRWAESGRRKKTRDGIELNSYTKHTIKTNDNDEGRRYLENCQMRSKHILNPVIDWTDENIWEYIKRYKLRYCKLYDEGFKRLGCIGCPMAGKKVLKEFKRYPKYKRAYIRSFQKMIDKRIKDGLETNWKTGEEVFDWWVNY